MKLPVRLLAAAALVPFLAVSVAPAALAWDEFGQYGEIKQEFVWGVDTLTGKPMPAAPGWVAPERPRYLPDTLPPLTTTPGGVPKTTENPDGTQSSGHDGHRQYPSISSIFEVPAWIGTFNNFTSSVNDIQEALFGGRSFCNVGGNEAVPTGTIAETSWGSRECVPIGEGNGRDKEGVKGGGSFDALVGSGASAHAKPKPSSGGTPRCQFSHSLTGWDGANALTFAITSKSVHGAWTDSECRQLAQGTPSDLHFYVTCLKAGTKTIYRPVNVGGSWVTSDTNYAKVGFGDNPENFKSTFGNKPVTLCPPADKLLATSWIPTRDFNGAPGSGWLDTPIKPGSWTNPAAASYLSESTVVTTDLVCANAAGQSITVSESSSPGTKQIPVPGCPPGYSPQRTQIKTGPQVIPNVAPPFMQPAPGPTSIAPGAKTKYPECLADGSPGCNLQVHVDGVRCTVGAANCVDWWPIYEKQPSRVVCKWGPYNLAGSACDPIRDGYKSERGTQYDPNLPPDYPPVPVGPGGVLVPGSKPPPVPNVPGVPTAPTWGLPDLWGGQPKDENKIPGCLPTGWAWFNPVEWVAKPVGCAMREVFIPKQDGVKNLTDGLKTKLDRVGIKPSVDKFTTDLQAAGSQGVGGGCMGPLIVFEVKTVRQDIYPFQSCTAPMSTIAGIAYAVTSLSMIIFGGFALIRAIAAGFGFNFSMGKGE